jgi:hypothetical protein
VGIYRSFAMISARARSSMKREMFFWCVTGALPSRMIIAMARSSPSTNRCVLTGVSQAKKGASERSNKLFIYSWHT